MSARLCYRTTAELSGRVRRELINDLFNDLFSHRKQPWLWSLGDTYRIKDRPRYMSYYGTNSAMDTTAQSQLRYSVGDNNNNEVCIMICNVYY